MATITITSSIDSSMTQQNADTNNGTAVLYFGFDYKSSTYYADRPILNFDASLIGAATITSVSLTLNVTSASSQTAVAATMYRVRRTTTWTESGVTWNKYDGTNAWTMAGAGDTTNDIDTANAVSFTSPGSLGDWTIATGTNFVALMQDAITSRSGILAVLLKFNTESRAEASANRTDQVQRTGTYDVRPRLTITYTGGTQITCALTGTVTTALESDIVAGGKTIILTLTNATWVAAGATFDGQRQNIINNLKSAQFEASGWNNKIKPNIPVANVVRTSDTVVTITLQAQADYSITADETITSTIPMTATAATVGMVASPAFTITNEGAAPAVTPKRMRMGFGL